MAESKKHHYVPQSLLRKFGYDNNKIYVYDKNSKNIFSSSIVDAGSENHFNTVIRNGERVNFEEIFQNNDDNFANIIDKIIKDKNLHGLSNRHKEDLINILAIQFFRTKMYRTSIKSIAEELKSSLSHSGISNEHLAIPSDNAIKELALSCYTDIQNDFKILNGKVGILIQSNIEANFILSDNPVTLHNLFPYGKIGLKSPGVEIYLPLSPKLTFALYCPTIFEKMEVYLKTQPKSEFTALYKSILKGVYSGQPVSLGSQTSKFLNILQVEQSSRFIYAKNKSDFYIADVILANRPDATHVKSLIKVGKLGQAPQKNQKMPKGDWIVLYIGKQHSMIRVFEVSDKIDNFSFTIKSIEDATFLSSVETISEISLYNDGQETIFMRDAKFEYQTSSGEETRFTVLHRLKFLNHI